MNHPEKATSSSYLENIDFYDLIMNTKFVLIQKSTEKK